MTIKAVEVMSMQGEILKVELERFNDPKVNNNKDYYVLRLGTWTQGQTKFYFSNPQQMVEIKKAVDEALENYKVCPNCEQLTWFEDFSGTAEGKVCDDCYSEVYKECDDCGVVFHEDDLFNMDLGRFCGSCRYGNLTKEEIAEIKADI